MILLCQPSVLNLNFFLDRTYVVHVEFSSFRIDKISSLSVAPLRDVASIYFLRVERGSKHKIYRSFRIPSEFLVRILIFGEGGYELPWWPRGRARCSYYYYRYNFFWHCFQITRERKIFMSKCKKPFLNGSLFFQPACILE